MPSELLHCHKAVQSFDQHQGLTIQGLQVSAGVSLRLGVPCAKVWMQGSHPYIAAVAGSHGSRCECADFGWSRSPKLSCLLFSLRCWSYCHKGHHVLRVHVSEYTRPPAVVHTAMLLLPSRPTLNPKPSNLNPKLSTLNPTPSTLNEAESQKLKSGEWISMIKAGDARDSV